MFLAVALLLHLGDILQGLKVLLFGRGRGRILQIQGGER